MWARWRTSTRTKETGPGRQARALSPMALEPDVPGSVVELHRLRGDRDPIARAAEALDPVKLATVEQEQCAWGVGNPIA